MNRDLIKIHALSNKYYAEEIEEGYIIPSFLYKDDGSTIDLKGNRNNSKLNSNSSYSTNFKNDLIKYKQYNNSNISNYITEFPFIINDSILWNKLLDIEGAPMDDKNRTKKYFIFDFLFPNIGTIVEIDSNLHTLYYDRARDKYVKIKTGIETIRFFEYGEDPFKRKDYWKSFLEKINKISTNRINKITIDQSEIIVDNYIRDNKFSVNSSNIIESYVGEELFKITDGIILTYSDLVSILPNYFNQFIEINQLNINIEYLKDFFKNILKKDLIIFPTNNYSYKIIYYLLSGFYDNGWNLFINNNISTLPGWVKKMFGKIPKEYRDNISYNNLNDNTIEEFIKWGNYYKILPFKKP